MTTLQLRIGAFIKGTDTYHTPDIATKLNKYVCMDKDCKKEVIYCNNPETNLKAYFRHKPGSNCTTYNENPGESIKHRDAKQKLKLLLETETIKIRRKCQHYKNPIFSDVCEINCCKKKIKPSKNIKEEYSFNYNGKKYADIAYLDEDNKLKYIFEIYQTSRTKEENRTGNWFEFKADDVLKNIEENNKLFHCVRYEVCKNCIKKTNEIEEENKKKLDREKKQRIAYDNKKAETIKQREAMEALQRIETDKREKVREEKEKIQEIQRIEREEREGKEINKYIKQRQIEEKQRELETIETIDQITQLELLKIDNLFRFNGNKYNDMYFNKKKAESIKKNNTIIIFEDGLIIKIFDVKEKNLYQEYWQQLLKQSKNNDYIGSHIPDEDLIETVNKRLINNANKPYSRHSYFYKTYISRFIKAI